jgi:hypothetical protein
MLHRTGYAVKCGVPGGRADQFLKMGYLLGWQLHYHPKKVPAIQGRQYNCRPNGAEN